MTACLSSKNDPARCPPHVHDPVGSGAGEPAAASQAANLRGPHGDRVVAARTRQVPFDGACQRLCIPDRGERIEAVVHASHLAKSVTNWFTASSVLGWLTIWRKNLGGTVTMSAPA
jgi:hypothetical protein